MSHQASSWYARQGGLNFACTQCGKCCARPGYIDVLPEEAHVLADRFQQGASPEDLEGILWSYEQDFDVWSITVPEGGHCPFLVDGMCSVHDVKPQQCRTYPFWPEILASKKTWEAEAVYCEGIREDGEHYPPTLIDKILEEEASTKENPS